jgi:imidazole glycerol phosphate synthase glutamine amidotransferase subunit
MRVVVVSAGGLGNVRSVLRAIEHTSRGVASDIRLEREPEAVRSADVVVVPGQGTFGAFARAMTGGMGEVLAERVHADRPYLGICLGLQVLFEESDEAPGERGLAVLRGRVRRLDAKGSPLPHIGWNAAAPASERSLLVKPTHFYFAHSFAAAPEDTSIIATTTDYGETFASAIAFGAVLGVQFHPEKSQHAGLALLERFFTRTAGTRFS